MRGLLTTLLFLHLRRPSEAACSLANLTSLVSSSGVLSWERLGTLQEHRQGNCVNISGTNITGISGSRGWRSPLKELDLSHNWLSSLPEGFLNHTEGLERLFLHGNRLSELPPAFFEATGSLRELRLEGNPLPSVPASLLHLCLNTLSVDCRCDVARSASFYCQRRNCTQDILCHCLSPQGFLNVTDFYAQQCGGLSVPVYVAIAASVLALLLGAAVAYTLIRRKKGATMVQEKRASSSSSGAQARYISHTNPRVDPARGGGGHADYENVFIGQPQEAGGGHEERCSRKQPKSRSHRKVQEDEPPPGEQTIYANTQELYYNCAGPPATPEEDLYVVPDQ